MTGAWMNGVGVRRAIVRGVLFHLVRGLLPRFRRQPGLRGLIVLPLLEKSETPSESTGSAREPTDNTQSLEILLPFGAKGPDRIPQSSASRMSSGEAVILVVGGQRIAPSGSCEHDGSEPG